MKQPTIIIRDDKLRECAIAAVLSADEGTRVSFKKATRTDVQNAKMWAMLNDLSRQEPGGRKHTPEAWKALVMHACGWEMQFLPGLNGEFFPTGFRSSQLTIKQMADLITWMYAFGAEHNIKWSEPAPENRRGMGKVA